MSKVHCIHTPEDYAEVRLIGQQALSKAPCIDLTVIEDTGECANIYMDSAGTQLLIDKLTKRLPYLKQAELNKIVKGE